jgi:hypothetical protein
MVVWLVAAAQDREVAGEAVRPGCGLRTGGACVVEPVGDEAAPGGLM